MNQQEQRQEQRNQTNPTKHLFIIICLYLILYFASSKSSHNQSNLNDLKTLIKSQQNNNNTIPLILKSYLGHMEGHWVRKNRQQSDNFLWKNQGKFSTSIIQNNNKQFYIKLIIKNGQYIDNGLLRIQIKHVNVSQWSSQHSGNVIKVFPLDQILDLRYQKQVVFQTQKEGQQHITKENFKLKVSIDESDNLIRQLQIIQFLQQKSMTFIFEKQQSKFFGTIVLALILFIIAYTQFFSIMSVLRAIFQGSQQASNFSFVTVLFTLLWDAVFCIIAFMQAFTSQQSNENLILFIIPAFIFCLIFTNLELRLMLQIYKANSGQNTNLSIILCKFNLIAYGCLISLFPILYFINFNNILFILISFIFLPQIYINGKVGKRPNLNSSYYNQFLIMRFLIIFYIKCFPYNIFQLQPQYFLGIGCLCIIICQYGLLWVQKIYGSKAIIPKCLLPPIFDYNTNIDFVTSQNLQNNQCSICLNHLKNKPPDIDLQQQNIAPCQIMRTPCGHYFHGVCLVNWMNIKMQCPQCRGKLPAYE